MLRLRLTPSIPLCLVAFALAASCAREVEIQPAPDPSKVVIAQFDPTHAVPVLQIVPSPTALAEVPGTPGLIDQVAVKPEECELPTAAQCLAFVTSWPTSALPTYYFSGDLDMATVADGIKLYEKTATGLVSVAYTPRVEPRPAPNPACQVGGNGSDPPVTYNPADVPAGIQVILVPTGGLKAGTTYLVAVVSDADGGLRAADGTVLEPAKLYSLLNVKPELEPVTADGVIVNALLRSNVQGTILAQRFGGRGFSELSDEEKTRYNGYYQASSVRLRGLYQFFNSVAGGLEAAGVVSDRKSTIYVNSWTTGGAGPTVIDFDPAAGKFPFPNVPLMTVPDAMDVTDLHVMLPAAPNDTPTAAALKRGLNTLNGFSTTAPMVVTASRPLDPASLQGNIVMYPLNAQGMPNGAAVPLTIGTSSASGAFTVTIRPTAPLQGDTNYVVAIKKGVTDASGSPVTSAQVFEFMKLPGEIIDSAMNVNPAVLRQLQCSTVPTMGRLATDQEVIGTATALETQLSHQRWLPAFAALESLSAPIPRTEVLLAWNHKTQDITNVVSAAKAQLIPLWESTAVGGRVAGPLREFVGTASIAGPQLVNVPKNLCVPICATGGLQGIAPADCATYDDVGNVATVGAGVAAHPICQFAISLIAGGLAKASLYQVRMWRATTGSPFTSGTFTPETLMAPELIQIPMWIVTPAGPAPANGYPVAIFQHGLGQNKETGFLISNTLATINANGGWATILIDLPFHGSRASDLARRIPCTDHNDTVCATALPGQPGQCKDSGGGNFFCYSGTARLEAPCVDANGIPNISPDDVQCNPLTGTCTGGCDGVPDNSGTGFLSTNVFSARDNFRQGTIDHLTLLRTIQMETQAGGALDFLDGSKIGYVGQSLGGITGANFMAYATPTDITAGVINVGGGSLTTILINTVPQISAGLFAALNAAGVCDFKVAGDPTSGCKPGAAFNQFLLTAQWALDPGDPLATSINVNTAAGIGTPNLLFQMSKPDKVVTNLATYALAGSLGVAPAGDNRLQVYDFSALPQANAGSGCHGWLLAPLCGACLADVLCNTVGAQQQAAIFLDTDAQTIAPKRPAQVAIYACDNTVCD